MEGFRSIFAFWVGGASNAGTPASSVGYRSIFSSWMGGAGNPGGTPVQQTKSGVNRAWVIQVQAEDIARRQAERERTEEVSEVEFPKQTVHELVKSKPVVKVVVKPVVGTVRDTIVTPPIRKRITREPSIQERIEEIFNKFPLFLSGLQKAVQKISEPEEDEDEELLLLIM